MPNRNNTNRRARHRTCANTSFRANITLHIRGDYGTHIEIHSVDNVRRYPLRQSNNSRRTIEINDIANNMNFRSPNSARTLPLVSNNSRAEQRYSRRRYMSTSIASNSDSDSSNTIRSIIGDSSNSGSNSPDTVTSNDYDECLVCLNNPRQYVLQNCGHVCLCGECVTRFRRQLHPNDDFPSTRCPLCRTPILLAPRKC